MCRCSSLALTSFRLDDNRVFGTWDFKWPQRSQIDVRFLAPSKAQLAALSDFTVPKFLQLSDDERKILASGGAEPFGLLTRLVECLARRWLSGPAKNANVTLSFVHDELVIPKDQLNADSPVYGYDVLVSLDDLPLDRSGRRAQEQGFNGDQFLPGSELGRYAERVDYGVATTYLGKREQYAGSSLDYFSSEEFVHWCVHEFGHVFGLPHEHQNPKVFNRIRKSLHRDPAKITEILAKALGTETTKNEKITRDEVEAEITTAWPVVKDRDTIQYSDFRDDEGGPVPDDRSSVMFHIFWQRLIEGGDPNAAPHYLTAPTEGDLKHLASMYPNPHAQR